MAHPERVEVYDAIGRSYRATRRPDLRIAAQIHSALPVEASVLNVGAGTGSYEPSQTIAAIEPSRVMIAQRSPGSAPCVQATAEGLPLRDKCVDAAMALLTVHHWDDVSTGIAQLCRVTRRRIVLFTWDQTVLRDFWLLSEYLPEAAAISQAHAVPIDLLVELLGGAEVQSVPVFHDCTDGFGAAYWRRPEAYLDPMVRAGISMLAQAEEAALAYGLARLAADLRSKHWWRRHADLLELEHLDVGYRLLVSDLDDGPSALGTGGG